MFVIKHNETGKYMAFNKETHSLESQKTIKTATVYPDRTVDKMKSLFSDMGLSDVLSIIFVQDTTLAENYLSIVGQYQYNKIEKDAFTAHHNLGVV